MELRHLRYFVMVAEELSFSRAAERLHMTQPPLSKQIIELEQELGAQLFDRGGRNITLTPSGKAFFRRARSLLEQVEQSKEEARRIELGHVGKISIGFADDTVFGPLSNIVANFLKHHPDVMMHSELALSPILARKVLHGEIDVAFVEPPLPFEANNLASFALPSMRLVVILPPDHSLVKRGKPVDLAELKNEKFSLCTPTPATSFNTQVEKLFEEAGFKPDVIHISSSSIMFAKIAAQAGFVAIAGEHSVPAQAEDFASLPIRSTASKIKLSLLWNAENTNDVAHNFVNHIKVNWPKNSGS